MKKIIALTLTICLTVALTIVPAAAKDYTDAEGHWAQEAVDGITDLGFFLGTSETTFSPNKTMTRAMFVTVLSRVASWMDLPVEHKNTTVFSDVNADAYYADAVAWASENGIVQGDGNGLFHPDEAITRQQMCAILVRFLSGYAGFDLSGYDADVSVFLDADSISAYAVQPVGICYAAGLIAGTTVGDGLAFRPTASSSRAVVAVVLSRVVPQVETWKGTVEEPGAANPGGAGGAGGTGGAGGAGGSEPSPEELEEAQVAGYLKTMLQNYRSSTYLPTTDQEVQGCMALLMGCIEDALNRRANGQFLSKDFIRSEYANNISELKAAYRELTDEQLEQLHNVIVRLESIDHIRIVMGYF